jgi:hypothetical protein
MIFAKKKILVWCDDPPEDRVISIVAGCLANHDRAHSPLHFRKICGECQADVRTMRSQKDEPRYSGKGTRNDPND